MAGERKENSVLFSLKELKDITAAEHSAPAAAAKAPVKRSSFSDEADSLLADIRDSVGADAAAEEARIEAQREAAANAERNKIMATRELQQADVQARLAAEEARRQAAAEERESRRRAIDIAERRARGEIIEEERPVVPAAVAAPAAVSPAQVAPPPEPTGRGTGFYLTVVGLPVLCLTAVAIALIFKTGDQPPINAPLNADPARVAVSQAATPSVAAAIPKAYDEEVAPDLGVAAATSADGGPPDAAVAVAAKEANANRRPRRPARPGDAPRTPPSKPNRVFTVGDGSGTGGITF